MRQSLRVSACAAFLPGLCVLSCLRGCGVVGAVDPIGLCFMSTTVSADVLAERAWNATLQAHLHSQPCGQHHQVSPFGELLLQLGLGSVLSLGLGPACLQRHEPCPHAPLQGREDEMRPYYRAGLSACALTSSARMGFRMGRGAGFPTHLSGRSCSQLPLPPTSLPRIFPLRL